MCVIFHWLYDLGPTPRLPLVRIQEADDEYRPVDIFSNRRTASVAERDEAGLGGRRQLPKPDSDLPQFEVTTKGVEIGKHY